MASDTTARYIVIPNWDRLQHYKDRQPAWIKLHLDLLGNDAWLDLSTDDRCLLITIWMLVGRYGNGRVKADLRWLQGQANLPLSNRYRGLHRLNEAGFIHFSASPVARPNRSLEEDKRKKKEGSNEPSFKEGDARANGAAPNGAAAREKEFTVAVATATAWLETDTLDHVTHTVRQEWPALADRILAQLGAPA